MKKVLSRKDIEKHGEESRAAARDYSWEKCAMDYAAALKEAQNLGSMELDAWSAGTVNIIFIYNIIYLSF